MKQSQIGSWPIVLVVVALACVFTVIWHFKPATNQSAPSPMSGVPSGWNTFHGDVTSISYPSTWFPINANQAILSDKSAHDFYTTGANAWFQAFFSNCTSSDSSFMPEYYLQANQLIKFICGNDLQLTLSVSPSDGSKAADEATLNQIAQSLQIIPVSQWKNYQNNQYGIALPYPPSWSLQIAATYFAPNDFPITQTQSTTEITFRGSSSTISLLETNLLTSADIAKQSLFSEVGIVGNLGGNKTTEYSSCATGFCEDTIYVSLKNSKTLVFDDFYLVDNGGENDGFRRMEDNFIKEEILANFKFLN